MKIIAISDMHGHLPDLPPCDLLLIAGDIFPGPYYPEESFRVLHFYWAFTKLRDWLMERGTPGIFVIGGNHDILFGDSNIGIRDALHDMPWTLLNDGYVHYAGLKICGSPWTKPITDNWPYEWTFAASEAEQVKHFAKIPNDVDILLTHAPPYSMHDKTKDGELAGSKALLARREQLPNLKLHVFGHIHEAFGGDTYRGCMTANVSHLGEYGRPRERGWLEYEL